MKTFESSWESKDGIKFYMRGWEPDKKPKAVVALVHGYGEHVGRYAHVAAAFNQAGYALVGFDLRGHGKSGGPRGHTPSYEALLDDVNTFLGRVTRRYRKLPYFLYGHSMGGNLVLNYALRRKPKAAGVIVSGPWLRLAFPPPPVRAALGRIMNNIAPTFTQPAGLEIAALSHNPEVVQAYMNDPLVHNKISARLFVSISEAGEWALAHAAEFPIPLLLMQGTGDRLISVEASREFAERCRRKVTWHPWDGFYHEIHNEPQQADVFKYTINWMNRRLRKG